MSNIRSLYDTLAGVSVAFTNEAGTTTTVTCKDLDQVKQLYTSPDLPVRVLLPVEEWGASNQPSEKLSVGTSGALGQMIWNMVDLMLFAPVGAAGNIEDVMPDLVRYCGAYAEMIFDNIVPVANIDFQTFTPNVGVYEYPINSGKQYFGVECMLSWRELINP